jgi:hypothetical protein
MSLAVDLPTTGPKQQNMNASEYIATTALLLDGQIYKRVAVLLHVSACILPSSWLYSIKKNTLMLGYVADVQW